MNEKATENIIDGTTEFPPMEIDINLPTPVEIARELEPHFCQDQAEAIAAIVYQPLREWMRELALRGVR